MVCKQGYKIALLQTTDFILYTLMSAVARELFVTKKNSIYSTEQYTIKVQKPTILSRNLFQKDFYNTFIYPESTY